MSLFEKPEQIYNRTILAHFLIPKNIQKFLSMFSTETQYADAKKASFCGEDEN
jgi:hypothetical protein